VEEAVEEEEEEEGSTELDLLVVISYLEVIVLILYHLM
jgi:hypothetical protein